MEIARDRFLDDGDELHMTLSLRSRTTAMHSLLTALSVRQRETISDILAKALDEVSAVVREAQECK
ncbi:MAG: hypothetical protein AB1635_06305 [Acidobacteriota bacterium]